MKDTIARGALIWVLMATVLAVSGCGTPKVKLRDIPASEIPSQFTSFMTQKPSPERLGNTIWRAYMDEKHTNIVGTTAAVCTAQQDSRDVWFFITLNQDTQCLSATGYPFPPSSPFVAAVSSGGKEGLNPILDANGTALDSRIAKIVATLQDGTAVETRPLNGFWWLRYLAKTPSDHWTEFKALDADGKTLYTQKASN